MKNLYLVLPILLLAVVGCEEREPRSPDNTANNVRDKNFDTLTAGNQSEAEADRTLSANIRKSLLDTDWLSNNAKNIKIITVDNVVTLRGVVDSQKEKDFIDQKAKSISGVSHVDNQLTILKK